MKIFLYVFGILGVFAQVEALTCWECENVFSDEECLEKGSLRTCRPNQNSCQIELRRGGWGPGLLITKRCKQAWACYNNFIQNSGQAWNKIQCNLKSPSGVCRCCCKTDECNRKGIQCWDEVQVSCLPHHKSLQDGGVECSDGNNVGSTCTFICDTGYSMIGTSRSTCLSTGYWDNRAPSCQRSVVFCLPHLEAPTHGRVKCSNENVGGSVCQFACNPGYRLVGALESTCNVDSRMENIGGWSLPPPSCTAIADSSCVEKQENPVNGAVSCTDEANTGSVCNFECSQGFVLIGEETSICLEENGVSEWQHAAPICQVIVDASCTEIQSNPSNGLVSCTNYNNVGSVCGFECNQGFTLIGQKTTTCIEGNGSAMWKYEAPVCEDVRCLPIFEAPVNGAISCSNLNKKDSKCQFVCDEGFNLLGSSSTICLENDNGTWSHLPPVCQETACLPKQNNPINGVVVCTNDNIPGSECEYACDIGFYLMGSLLTTCEVFEDFIGMWNQPAPVCLEMSCVPLQSAPDNGEVSCTNNNKFNSECQFSCHEGYKIVGPTSTICSANDIATAVWSHQPPICQEKLCPNSPSAPINGNVTCNDESFLGSKCSFTCDSQYLLRGNTETICVENDDGSIMWDKIAPICEETACLPEQNNPINGVVVCTNDNRPGSECEYACDIGFYLMGSLLTTCEVFEDFIGMWNQPAPVCLEMSCVPLQSAPDNGEVSCTNNNKFNSECQFSCHEGYKIVGSTSTICSANDIATAVWSHQPPICQDLGMECKPTYVDVLNGDVTCTNGNSLGSTCTFVCDDEFALVGEKNLICRKQDGSSLSPVWSDSPPTCNRKLCPNAPSAPINGKVTCGDESFLGSKCSFTCDSQYLLRGNTETTCVENDDGSIMWNKIAPTCEEMPCEPIYDDFEHGDVTCTNGNSLGSTCTFVCDDEFALIGEKDLICRKQDGSSLSPLWSDFPPACHRKLCPNPPSAPINGKLTCNDESFLGSKCSFTCESQYLLRGNTETTCVENDDGSIMWDKISPTCEEMPCEPIYDDFEHGDVTCTNGNSLGSTCTFVCDDEFALIGEKDLICQNQDGSSLSPLWSGSPPACHRKLCPNAPSAPINGKVTCNDESFLGSKCSFTCESQYLLRGNTETTCVENDDGSIMWDKISPTCEEIPCEPIYDDVEHGDVTCTNGNSLGSTCTFVCDDEFALFGEKDLICLRHDGSSLSPVWSDSPPICHRKLCPNPPSAPINGKVTCNDESFLGSKCSFTCESQYLLRGNTETTCVENDDGSIMWDKIAPTCEEMSCEPIYDDFEHGDVTCTNGNSLGSTCTFVCDDEFALIGEKDLICRNQDGSSLSPVWSDSSPACHRKLCANAPSAPINGKVTCNDESFLGSKCSFTCDSQYLLRGNTETTCVENDDGSIVWDKIAPTCEATGCKSQLSFPHGRAVCTNDGLPSSTCTFECTDTDYYVYPKTFVNNTCLDDDQWDVPTPCCARDCPPNAVMDFIVVLDSSSSVGGRNWDKMKTFIKGFLRKFTVSPEATFYGIFRYNSEVDTDRQILLKDFPNNKEDLLDAFEMIPYNGVGTHTGNAITHVTDVMLAPSNGNREKVTDIVLIITDGRSQDDVGEPAKRLRATGATVYVLPINPPIGSLDIGQVEEIVSDKQYIIDDAMVEGFGALTEEFASRIAKLICGDPCHHVLHEHE